MQAFDQGLMMCTVAHDYFTPKWILRTVREYVSIPVDLGDLNINSLDEHCTTCIKIED